MRPTGEIYPVGLLDPVMEEIGDQLVVLERDGLAYAKKYLAYLRAGGHGQAPHGPLGMHRDVAKAVRDICMDNALHARLSA